MLRRPAIVLVVLIGAAAASAGAAQLVIGRSARGRIYDVTSAPERSVGVIFGAGVGSQMLRDRVATGAALFHAHKVQHLLLTGDNRRRSYDEPRAMKRIAVELGVPDSAIILDYAGRRTYDSCARARSIFRLDQAILVTQGFHLPRALYLCSRLGLDVVGVSADRNDYRSVQSQWVREVFAGVRALLDVHVRPPRVVGGPALPIEPPVSKPSVTGEDADD